MLDRQHHEHPLTTLKQVIPIEQLFAAQTAVKEVHVAPPVKEYIISIVEATRAHDDVYLGASPRGSLALYNASRAWAALSGRDFVVPDDVKVLAEPTLAHRVIVSPAARIKNVDSRYVIDDLMRRLPVPGAAPTSQGRDGRATVPYPARAT